MKSIINKIKKFLLPTHYILYSKKKGFTLVETLVAITILIGGLAGPMTIASKTISSARYAKDQTIAFFLAEEAIEYIRNTRDTNSLNANSWLTGLTNCLGSSCLIDSRTPGVAPVSCGGTCVPIDHNSTTGFYGYSSSSGWAPSKFTRSVIINSIVANVEVEILVTVSWSSGTLSKSFTVSENLFDWQS